MQDMVGGDLMDGKERAEQEILNLKTAYAFVQE